MGNVYHLPRNKPEPDADEDMPTRCPCCGGRTLRWLEGEVYCIREWCGWYKLFETDEEDD